MPVPGARIADDSTNEDLQHAEFNYCYDTDDNIWRIFIPGEGIVSFTMEEYGVVSNPDATITVAKPIVTATWQGYLRDGQFYTLAELA